MGWEVFKSVRINVKPERIWKILQDVNSWHLWDIDLIKAQLDGSPTNLEGAEGNLEMKFRHGSFFRFRLQNLRENKYVEYQTQLPGAHDTIW
jgi:hypothetical protein